MSREKAKSDREIAIYWDYENVKLPQWCGPANAAKRIYKAVSNYGRVVDRRVYFDYQKYNGAESLDCSGLDLSGFDLVNTPTRNAKETLDKKLIADVLTFAWDCTARKTEPCVVLITSDGDYAYTLAKLRDRGVLNIVMFGKGCSLAQILVDNADVALSFEKDVLDSSEQSKESIKVEPPMDGAGLACLNLFFKNLPAMGNVKEFVQFIENNQRAVVRRAIMFGSDALYLYAHVVFMNANDGSRILNAGCDGGLTFRGRNINVSFDTNIPSESSFEKAPIDCRYERQSKQPSIRSGTTHTSHRSSLPQEASTRLGNKQTFGKSPQSAQEHVTTTLMDITKCCICLHNEQLSRITFAAINTREYEKCWLPLNSFTGPLGLSYSFSSKTETKNNVKCIVDKSVFEGYITVTRKEVESGLYVSVPWHKNRGVRNGLSEEAYLRLTRKGRMLVQTTFHEKKVNDFLSYGIKVPTEMCATSDGEQCSPSSQVQDKYQYGTLLHFSNLPNVTIVGNLVEFIENEHAAVVKCASVIQNSMNIDNKIEATATKDVDCCSADVLLANAQRGLLIAFLALTDGISFNGTQIKIKVISSQGNVDTLLEKISNSGDSKYNYMQIENLSQTVLDIPISDDSKAHAIIAEREFCSCLFKEQKLIGNAELLPCHGCWVPFSTIGTKCRSLALFSDVPKENCKALHKIIREFSLFDGLIEVGRRKMHGDRGYVNVTWSKDRCENDALSTECYLRLMNAGILLIQGIKVTKKEDEACVFLKNLPWPIQVLNLVQFLEMEYKAAVKQASVNYQHPNDCCDVHVEFINREDGLRICRGDIIMYSGREIYAAVDRKVPSMGLLTKSDPGLFYTKSNIIATDTVACAIEECSSAVFEKIATDVVEVNEEREDNQLATAKVCSAG
mmetsp:Transcript_33426/g.38051  ORF Transcript_33426/g.38051 Transcript_33426/m.38051 type:complete len:903 (+) Transcript_33426:196-2904(+)|eukprot:CAMPEP_0194191464 /NCGR_PEP_ID=MMETSP0154-20130528/66898_1 /TAXON_ID=1049557 /ORGANISM="Thalassiothrix antarctica, Strain L6-D1" /LENGTH=902 /DNA_ID=CAMNT_0038914139 /DNA_START=140 /DNA_END=2848 /DNA_ORIENTATION=+